MLSALLSNQSLEKVLYFVLLNGKCYATQLSRRFKTPLTPIQCALAKLEAAGVFSSHYIGKTRIYEFNANYPLLSELETLLKKAYTHLPSEQKKLFYNPSLPGKFKRKPVVPMGMGGARQAVHSVWDKLLTIKTMCFSAKSKSPVATGWNGIGRGEVEVKIVGSDALHFHEKGSWMSEEGKNFDFSNIFRWTLQAEKEAIVLEHLRFGVHYPVLLFSLVPTDTQTLESLEAHDCQPDLYFGQVRFDRHFLQLNWRVIGPKKNEEIDYLYT